MTAAGQVGLGQRIGANLARLAELTDEPGRITRLYLSPAHKRGMDLVAGLMREAGMSVRVTGLGDVIGRYEGLRSGSKALIIGSHIDSVPNGGAFDGCLGVMTGIEVVAALKRAGRRLPFAIEVVAFGDEEGVRFPSTLGGSRMLAGVLDVAILKEVDRDGVSRRAALQGIGCEPVGLEAWACTSSTHLGYVEVHIEQGPVLEAKGLPVGVVTAINGATRGTIEVSGQGGHAGTVPMALRRDAYAAAAEMALAIEQVAAGADDIVATVGRVDIEGAAINSVPGCVRFTLDLRCPSDERRKAAVDEVRRRLGEIARKRNVEVSFALGYDAPAAPCDAALVGVMERAVSEAGVSPLLLASGTGHDAMSFRGRLPFAMLFVRCRGGVSHTPQEHASIEDIDTGAHVLLRFLGLLDQS